MAPTWFSVSQLAGRMFFDFAFAFEITAALLTIAVVGAVIMARRPKRVEPIPRPEPLDGDFRRNLLSSQVADTPIPIEEAH